jgi:hypothetical protein
MRLIRFKAPSHTLSILDVLAYISFSETLHYQQVLAPSQSL